MQTFTLVYIVTICSGRGKMGEESLSVEMNLLMVALMLYCLFKLKN